MSAVDDLLAGRDKLLFGAWRKRVLVDAYGARCALGALLPDAQVHRYMQGEENEVYRWLQAQEATRYLSRATGRTALRSIENVYTYNDKARNREEVLDLYDRAIRLAKEAEDECDANEGSVQ